MTKFKFLRSLLPDWFKGIFRKIRFQLQLRSSVIAKITEPHEIGEVIKTVKEETIEKVSFQKTYDYILSAQVLYRSGKLDLMKYQNMTVFVSSDFLLGSNQVVWYKYYYPQFTKIIPSDQNLVKWEQDKLYIRKFKRTYHESVAFSLCGVASKPWAHFIVEYLPKLYLLPEILKIDPRVLTVIIPNYPDPQVREIVYGYLKNLERVKILELKDGETVTCDTLYHIDNTAWLSECIEYTSPIDGIIPKFVADALKKNLLADYEKHNYDSDKDTYSKTEKLFLARNNYRNLVNYAEVESYFIKKGYKVVYPHMLSLTEKIKLFKNALLIVGPMSSGFTNVIFSRRGTKVLMMMNFQKVFESYFGFVVDNFGIDITNICGTDVKSTDFNSSYYIPLSKIMEACDKLGF